MAGLDASGNVLAMGGAAHGGGSGSGPGSPQSGQIGIAGSAGTQGQKNDFPIEGTGGGGGFVSAGGGGRQGVSASGGANGSGGGGTSGAGGGGGGGSGGGGGGGAGGSVALNGSVVTASSSTIDTAGGAGAGFGNNGGGGRFLLGSNAGTGTTGINLTGASTTTFCGPTTGYPFVKGAPQTPYIPNLAGGAEGFGLLSGVDAASAQFAGVRAGAPAHAVGAIIREHLGPTPGYDTDFAGYDALLFVNLTAGELADPMLGDDPAGTDTAFMSALLTGGTGAQWFGSGATTLGLLDGEAIWETLIPTDGDFINASADGTIPIVGDALADGGVAYLVAVPEPATMALLGVGILGLVLVGGRSHGPLV